MQHGAAAMAALQVQPIHFVSMDARPLSAFTPSALPAKSPPPDVGRGLPLLF
jgi:hypothetical protein